MGIMSERAMFKSRDTQGIKKYFASLVNYESENVSFKVIYQSLRGNVIYEAVEHIDKVENKKTVYATVTKFGFDDGEIYHKRMDESMCPYYFDAPIRLIKLLTPTKSELALKWREEVVSRKIKKY